MFLWDSRTVHCNWVPQEGGGTRCVAYVCMVPRAWAGPEVLEKRVNLFRDAATTSHWPHFVKASTMAKRGERKKKGGKKQGRDGPAGGSGQEEVYGWSDERVRKLVGFSVEESGGDESENEGSDRTMQ